MVSLKPQCKDVYRRTIEITQRTRIFKTNCLKLHNVRLKLASPLRDKKFRHRSQQAIAMPKETPLTNELLGYVKQHLH